MSIAYFAYLAAIAIEFLGIDPLNAVPLPLILLLTGYVLISYTPKDFLRTTQAKIFIFLVLSVGSGLIHGFIQSYAFEPFKQWIGYTLLVFVSFYILDSVKRINGLLAMLVGLMVYLSLTNFDMFMSAREGFFRAGYFLGDGNDFAWGLNFVLPLSLYLFLTTKNVFRYAYLGATVLLGFGIIGTQSRGASLALAAACGFLWLMVSKKKVRGLVVISVATILVLSIAPNSYFERMGSIANYQEDSSAEGRLHAWNKAFLMALDHPILGVGAGSFNSAYGREYRGEDDPVRWISTHSIYFKVLAENGFTGLFALLLLLWTNYKTNRDLKRFLKAHGHDSSLFPKQLPDMLSASLVAFSVAGTFLTGLSYPYIFILSGVILATDRVGRRVVSEQGSVDAVAMLPENAIPRYGEVMIGSRRRRSLSYGERSR